MRVVGLDVGTKRIGVAVSDPLGWTAQAHSVVARRTLEWDLQVLAGLVADLEAARVVVGLPLRLDGSEGPAAESVKEFATALANVIAVPVELYDERLTTAEAEGVLLAGDLSRRRRRQVIDKVAAALILDGYLRHAAGKTKPRFPGRGGRQRGREGMEEFEEIVIVNDEGEEFNFAVDRLFELSGKRYAVLIPMEDAEDGEEEDGESDEESDEEEEGEETEESAVIFRLEKDEKGEDVLADIEDDEEFAAAERRYYELCSEEDEE